MIFIFNIFFGREGNAKQRRSKKIGKRVGFRGKYKPLMYKISRLCGKRLYPCTVAGCTYVGKDVTALRYHQPVHTGRSLYIVC